MDDEDWRGIDDSQQRKKIQNRLAQRRRRRSPTEPKVFRAEAEYYVQGLKLKAGEQVDSRSSDGTGYRNDSMQEQRYAEWLAETSSLGTPRIPALDFPQHYEQPNLSHPAWTFPIDDAPNQSFRNELCYVNSITRNVDDISFPQDAAPDRDMVALNEHSEVETIDCAPLQAVHKADTSKRQFSCVGMHDDEPKSSVYTPHLFTQPPQSDMLEGRGPHLMANNGNLGFPGMLPRNTNSTTNYPKMHAVKNCRCKQLDGPRLHSRDQDCQRVGIKRARSCSTPSCYHKLCLPSPFETHRAKRTVSPVASNTVPVFSHSQAAKRRGSRSMSSSMQSSDLSDRIVGHRRPTPSVDSVSSGETCSPSNKSPPLSPTSSITLRFRHIFDAMEAAGFETFDDMASDYYTVLFPESDPAHNAQRCSRTQHLGRFLAKLKSAAMEWEQKEKQGWIEEIVDSAENLYVQEVRMAAKRAKTELRGEDGAGQYWTKKAFLQGELPNFWSLCTQIALVGDSKQPSPSEAAQSALSVLTGMVFE